ncbi:phage tail tape measure protein [Ruoffia sp. FAM 24228]|uniref:phage tail tape measure protein n=1 Tax=Ruoffia sp. FAM 24228 TaxID=3259517 RepID=UPI0038862E94
MTIREAGVRLTLQGEAAYRAGIKGISQEMRTLATESKLTIAQLGNNASTTDTYSAKMKSMGNEIQMASRQTEVLKNRQSDLPRVQKEISSALDGTNKAYKESSDRTKELQKQYETSIGVSGRYSKETIEIKEALDASKEETKLLEAEVNKLSSAYSKNEKELAKLPNELAKAELATQELRNETQRLHEEYRNAGGRLADTSKKWRDVGKSMVTVGGQMSQAGDWMTTRFTLPIVAGFGAAIKTGLTFDQQMRQTAAIAGLTAEDLTTAGGAYEQLREQAIQLGADSIFGATDVSIAQEMMASAGLEVTEIIGAIPGVMDLAAVSGKDMALASQAVATAMNQFGLEASDATHVADVFARAAADTNAETHDMAEALKFAGNVLGPMGIQFEEAAAAIGIMSNAGITGSMAGTALRGAFTRLANPTKQVSEAMAELGWSAYDAEGNIKPLSQMIPELRESLVGLTNEQRDQYLASIFGTNALSGMLALVNSAPGELEALTASLENSEGAAKSMAEVINSGANGAIEELMGAVETLSIELFDTLAPSLISVVEGITGAVEAFSDLDEGTQKSIIQGALFVAAAGPIVSVLGRITTGTGHVVTGVGNMIQWFGKMTTPKTLTEIGGTMTTLGTATGTATTNVGLFSTAIGLIASPVGIATVTIGGLYAAYRVLTEESRNAHNAISEFPSIDGVTHEQAESIRETYDAYSDLTISLETLSGQTLAYADTVSSAVSDIVSEIKRINSDNIEEMAELYKELPPQVAAMYDDLIQQEERVGNHRISRSQQVQADILQIMEQAQEDKRNLTDAEQQYLIQARNELAALQAESLGANAEQSRQIYDTLTADLASMNSEQLMVHQQNIQSALQNMEYGFEQQKKQILNTVGETHPEVAQAMIQELESVYDISRDKMMSEWAKTLATQGEMAELSGQELYQAVANYMNSIIPGLNILPEEVRAMMEDTSTAMQDGVENMVQPLEGADARVQEAAQKFNYAIMQFANSIEEGMSPENLNADQLDQFMQQINDLGVTWNDLKFMRHSPEIDDNTKEFIDRIVEAHGGWEAIELAEKQAGVSVMGMEELEQLIALFGVDFAGLTDEQKQALINADGAKELSDLMVEYGIWVATDPAEAKQAVVETDDALMKFQPLLENLGLWNSTEFLSKYADIDSNAPDVQDQIANLISVWSGIPVEEIKTMMTDTNADETTPDIQAYRGEVEATPATASSTFTAGVGGVSEATGIASDWKGTVEEVPESKASGIQTNVFSTIANTLAVTLYNAAVGAMTDKSVEASTSTPNMLANTLLITGYNSASGKMKDTQATATTRTPSLPSNTNLVNDWNSAMRAMFDKTSTATTRTPNIASNTSSVWSWINALNSAYNRTSTLTTRRVTAYSTTGISPRGYKDGGHIDAYADGGNIKWGGMFANGGNVPQGYMGIVGEAGPELFHVTKSGVSITPLASNEKMRGVTGAIEDEVSRQLTNRGDGVNLTINIDKPVLSKKEDINSLTNQIVRKASQMLAQQAKNKQKGRPAW